MLSRREFLHTSAAAAGATLAPAGLLAQDKKEPFKISLAQWSLNKSFFGKVMPKLDPLDFAKIAKNDYGIDAIEYVNQFYKDKKNDGAYLIDLKKRADGEGVRSVLIMCDGEGALGDPDNAKRLQAVENHKRWIEWAKLLGCHSIRVNAQSSGSYDDQMKLAADGLRKLCEVGEKFGINVIVENHGGLSSNGKWLAATIKMADHPRCGTLPDFGNFRISRTKDGKEENYDRYQGVDELMPFAKGVSAKSHDFNEAGEETHTDYKKMMDIVVKKHKYNGYVGIEYEGGKINEADGIKATKRLLEKIRAGMTA
jgi:sugar phosphate isomerase/epimerase